MTRLSWIFPSATIAAFRTSGSLSFKANSKGSMESSASDSASLAITASRVCGLLARSCWYVHHKIMNNNQQIQRFSRQFPAKPSRQDGLERHLRKAKMQG